MIERHIDINRFDYDLPDGRIAKFPLPERSSSKLLVYRGGEISEAHFADMGDVLPEGQLLVFNNTKVIRARIIMHKPSGARIEVFCLEPHDPADYERAFAVTGTCQWSCIVGNLKKWKEGYVEINFEHEGRPEHLRAWIAENRGREHTVRFEWSAAMTFGQLLEYLGRIPIPPYLNRESELIDYTRYQTVYSKFEGSVAAPTAGLHFTPELIEGMKARGFGFEEVTLHVGAGTFLPVKDEDAAKHPMHTEHFEVRRATVVALLAKLGAVTAVGTTSVRTLESLPALAWRIHTGVPIDARAPWGSGSCTTFRQITRGAMRWRSCSLIWMRRGSTGSRLRRNHDRAAGVRVPHRAQHHHQFPPAEVDAATAGLGIRGRRLAAHLRLRALARFPFPELRRLVGADALTGRGQDRGGRIYENSKSENHMAIERVRAYLEQYGAADRVLEFGVSSATVELAAKALGCEPGRIAKSLSFGVGEGYIVIVTAGDCKIDNAKYKAKFHAKARMLTPPEVEEHIGHAVGGVCPFGVNDGVAVYLDESLRRFGTVFPACGSSNSAIELTIEELERYSRCAEWVDVCKRIGQ